MPLDEKLHSIILTDAEKKPVALIERHATQSPLSRFIELFGLFALFASPAAAYYLLQHFSEAGLAICKLQNAVYIPQTGALEKFCRYPIIFICSTAFFCAAAAFQLQKSRRLTYRILVQVLSRSNVAQP